MDTDGDGVSNAEESQVPNRGGSGSGDGNGDGTPDAEQSNVASFPSATDGVYLTLATTDDLVLAQVESSLPVSIPSNVTLPLGQIRFQVQNVTPGGAVMVTLYIHGDVQINGYWKFSASSGWHDFAYNGTTGAVVESESILLRFVDGERGDVDALANGVIVDPGAPVQQTYSVWMPSILRRNAQSGPMPEPMEPDASTQRLEFLWLPYLYGGQ